MHEKGFDLVLLRKTKGVIVNVIAYEPARVIRCHHIITFLCQGLGDVFHRKGSLHKHGRIIMQKFWYSNYEVFLLHVVYILLLYKPPSRGKHWLNKQFLYSLLYTTQVLTKWRAQSLYARAATVIEKPAKWYLEWYATLHYLQVFKFIWFFKWKTDLNITILELNTKLKSTSI